MAHMPVTLPNPTWDAFLEWMAASGVGVMPDVLGMPLNFVYPEEPDADHFVYPRLTAELMLAYMSYDMDDEAAALVPILLTWQSTANSSPAEQKIRGGWPSIVAEDPANPGEWIACASADGTGTARNYSHDALVILTALCEMYNRQPSATILTAITLAGDFIVRQSAALIGTYRDASEAGPVDFVDHDGNYSTYIYGSVAYCYIGGMDMLTTITGDNQYSTCASEARAFFELGQHAQGWFYDHYEPEYPPQAPPAAYSAARWKRYHEGNSQILADNVMHSALGAAKNGDTSAARAAWNWLVTAVDQNGGVPGYLLTGAAGAHGFGAQPVYHDVVSTGEWRSLCQWLGETEYAEQAARYCEAAQNQDGAYYWGRYRNLGTDATGGAEAPHTGIWCVADISVFGTDGSPDIPYDQDLWRTRRLVSIAVTPVGQTITTTQQFTATATYDDGETEDVTEHVFWHSTDAAVATVAQTGIVTAVGADSVHICATIGRVADSSANVADA